MKKYITLIIMLLIILLTLIILLIIQKKDSGTYICKYKSKNITLESESIYKITFKNKYVEKLETKEKIISNDLTMLSEYKDTLNEIYSEYNNLKYYTYKVELKNKELTTFVSINYNKLNKEEYINIDINNENIYKGEKVLLKTLKKIYKEKGAKCKYV